MDNTIQYYNDNAETFIDDTIDVDMGHLYSKFLSMIMKGGSILDAGCGSGRDTKYFQNRGYVVHAFDASAEIAKKASQYLGQKVDVSTFIEYQSDQTFDAIWACASLLHVPEKELAATITSIARYLKPGGVLYMSFKYGTGERIRNGRAFTDLDETGIDILVDKVSGLTIRELWLTGDQRSRRENERWMNVLLLKSARNK